MSTWYGGRSRRELFYLDHFYKLEKSFSNFKFYISLSEPLPEDNWKIKKDINSEGDGFVGFIHIKSSVFVFMIDVGTISGVAIILAFMISVIASFENDKFAISAILFGVAGLYIYLWADFISGVQLLVYIGGINVLIIFGIMLTNRIASVRLSQTNLQQGVGGVFAFWVFMILSLVISKTSWYQMTSAEPSSTVREVGTLLMTKYLLPFEAASILLLGALIGAAILSREAN